LEIVEEIRIRDAERLELEIAGGGLEAGKPKLLGNAPKPTPFTKPKRAAQPLNEEAKIATEATG
jgi:glutathione-regulated potassium-efflux system protein KefB